MKIWRLWEEGNPLVLFDKGITENFKEQEVLRLIHIGLLCVQKEPSKRPNMSTVVFFSAVTRYLSQSFPLPQASVLQENQQRLIPRGETCTSGQQMAYYPLLQSPCWSMDNFLMTFLAVSCVVFHRKTIIMLAKMTYS